MQYSTAIDWYEPFTTTKLLLSWMYRRSDHMRSYRCTILYYTAPQEPFHRTIREGKAREGKGRGFLCGGKHCTSTVSASATYSTLCCTVLHCTLLLALSRVHSSGVIYLGRGQQRRGEEGRWVSPEYGWLKLDAKNWSYHFIEWCVVQLNRSILDQIHVVVERVHRTVQ